MYEKLNGLTSSDLNAFQNPVPFLLPKNGGNKNSEFHSNRRPVFIEIWGIYRYACHKKTISLLRFFRRHPDTPNKKAEKGFRVTVARMYF